MSRSTKQKKKTRAKRKKKSHGNIEHSLGRYCCDSNNYGCFEIISCHLMDILFNNYIISFSKFNQKYSLQRTNNNEIKNVLLSILEALKYEESQTDKALKNAIRPDGHGIITNKEAILNKNIIAYTINKLCNENGININEFNELQKEILKLNMSFIGAIPIHILNEIINYYQRTFLLSFSNYYPLDVHRIILCYCHMFKSDRMIDTIKCKQILLFDISKEVEYVFNAQWMIARVEDIIYGPMGNIIQILIIYRIGRNNYANLWLNIKYIEWIHKYQCWKYNIILILNKNKNMKQNKLLQYFFETNLNISLFESWFDMYVKKWIEHEKIYKTEQKKLQQQKTSPIAVPINTPYITIHRKRKYKSQRR